jgi:hypothetical protein
MVATDRQGISGGLTAQPRPYERGIMNRHTIIESALFLALLAVLCQACAGPRVVVNYDRAADFGAYRTYGFSTQLATDDGDTTTLLSKFLKAAASRELEARGYRPAR